MSMFPPIPKRADSHLPLHLICSAFAIVPALVLAYADRYAMWPDGVNYLEMGDAYLRGDWNAAINGLWSPLYSWILALAMLLFKPSIYWEFPLVHVVNFVIYLVALASFQFFLHELVRYGRSLVHTGINSCTFPVGKRNLPTLRNREHCRVGTASPCPP